MITNKLYLFIAIIAVILLSGYFIWSSHNRFYVTDDPNGITYEIDKKTGESWVLYEGQKIKQEVERDESKLPDKEKSLVDGTYKVKNGICYNEIYNGSTFTITRIIFGLDAIYEDGATNWSRLFQNWVTIPPMSTKSFSFTVTSNEEAYKYSGFLDSVYGKTENLAPQITINPIKKSETIYHIHEKSRRRY